MRINKYLASAGLGSRRSVEELVLAGRVKVNKETVTKLSFDVNENNDTVLVDGQKIELKTSFTYILFNKPKGCICTTSDEKGRKTIYDYLNIDTSIHSVGRLDYDTEGLLILTDDGDLHNRLTHPTNEVPKTYMVKVEGIIEQSDLAIMRKGIIIDDVKTGRCKIKLKETEPGNIVSYFITIYEGRNRQVRKMFEAIGKDVIFLRRVAIGDLKLGGLGRGAQRFLKEEEIFYLKNI